MLTAVELFCFISVSCLIKLYDIIRMNLKEKNVIITGATSGIGRETAIALARENSSIVMPVRDIEKGERIKKQIIGRSGNPAIYVMECDLASFDSIRSFSADYKKRFGQLHVLINNAGIWKQERDETRDGIEMNFGVNHLAPFLLTSLLLDELRSGAPSRVINVSSEAHRYTRMNFDDPEGKKKFSSFQSYGQSKLANILFTRYLAGMLRKDGVTVNCLHPGVVDTNLFENMNPLLRKISGLFMTSPRKGAETTVYLATSPDINGQTGRYFVRNKDKKPSRAALDEKSAEKLWELSMKYVHP